MISQFADWFVSNILHLSMETPLGSGVHFFVYDSVKILLLLLAITHFMSLLRYYLPIDKLRDYLASHKFYGLDYFFASIFGALTPFCSCSSLPLFIGFIRARIPLGVTFAFLITSPLINEIALTLFWALFGFKVTMVYLIGGLLVGMVGGFVLGKLHMEKYIADFLQNISPELEHGSHKDNKHLKFWKEVFPKVSREARGIFKKIALYVLIGVGIGAFLHGYVPEGFFENKLAMKSIFTVPLAVILAVPLYANASGVIPIIESLVGKGVPIGTALAFMMAVVGLSFPEAMILKKILKLPLLLTFFGIVTLGIIILGYIFNIVL
jgi:uncharacterized protein